MYDIELPIIDIEDAELAKREAIASVERNNAMFVDRARVVIERIAEEQLRFTALDVWKRYSGPMPASKRAMGAAFHRAARDGIAHVTKEWVPSGRRVDHNQLIRIWESDIVD